VVVPGLHHKSANYRGEYTELYVIIAVHVKDACDVSGEQGKATRPANKVVELTQVDLGLAS